MTLGAFEFNLTDLTACGILGIAVLMVLIGQLIPKWVVTQIKNNCEDQLRRAEKQVANLEAALTASNRAREVQAKQLDDLLELGTATDAFIRSLQDARRKDTP